MATPVYPWYALPLAVLVIMSQRWEWLAVWAAAYVAFVFDHSVAVQVAAYGGALVVVVRGDPAAGPGSAAGRRSRTRPHDVPVA